MPTTPMFQFGSKPGNSGNVFLESYSVKATNDTWDGDVLIFNDTSTRDGFNFRFRVPDDYVSGASYIIEWTSTATSGDVEFDIDYRAVGGDDAESLDQATAQETLNQNDTAPTSAHNKMTATLTATATNFSPGDIVQGTLFRDGTDLGDGIAAAVIVFDAVFDYANA